MAAFALALGVAAHVLDELNGRPLRTQIGSGMLVALAVVSLAGACAIGVWAALAWGFGLLVFVAVGAFLVPAYNLEWFGGRFHNAWWLALSWAAFPVLTAYFAQAQTLRAEALLAAAYATGADPRPADALDAGPHARGASSARSPASSRWSARSASCRGRASFSPLRS